jgi:hypothetical protein
LMKKLTQAWKRLFASLTESSATIKRTCARACLACGVIFLCASFVAIHSLTGVFLWEPIEISSPGVGGDGLAFAMMLIGGGTPLAMAVTLLVAGAVMLRESRQASDDDVAATAGRCGKAVLCLALLPALPFLGYLMAAMLPFESLAPVYLILFPYRGAFFITYYLAMAAAFPGGWLILIFATKLLLLLEMFLLSYAFTLLRLSRRLRDCARQTSARSFPERIVDSFARPLQRRIAASDAAANRLCASLCFLFAAVLVIPMAAHQVAFWLARGEPTLFLSIWLNEGMPTAPITPMLLTVGGHLIVALVAVVVGKRLWAKAAAVAATPGETAISSRFRATLLWGGAALLVATPIAYAIMRHGGLTRGAPYMLGLYAPAAMFESLSRERPAILGGTPPFLLRLLAYQVLPLMAFGLFSWLVAMFALPTNPCDSVSRLSNSPEN